MTTRSRYVAAITDKPWWLTAGISSADCIAVFQPIGAASYALSKVNLANPGTYNLTNEATYPNWDSTNGWTVALGAGLTMGNYSFVSGTDYSWICRLTNANNGEVGFPILTAYNFAIVNQIRSSNYQTIYRDTQKNNSLGSGLTSHVVAITRYGFFNNGSIFSSYSASEINNTKEVRILWNASTGLQMDIKAWALYKINLDETKVAALTTAMNAL